MLAQARQLLQMALPDMRDYALLLLDPQGIVVGWLWGCEEVFGYSEAEAVGRPGSFLFVPEDLEKGLDRHELEIAARDSRSQDDRWHLRKDGQRIWASGSVTALRDEGGLHGFVKIVRDRTDQRLGQEARANRLADAEAALLRTRQFLQTLGHELRNPLGPIKNSVHLLSRLSEDPRVRKVADTVRNQVAVLERITSDLMDVSRLEHKKLDLRLDEVDARALVQEAAAGQAPAARAKGIELQAVTPAYPILALVDADRLRQALGNMLSNAIKYTPAGGQVWAKVTQEAEDLVVRVEDTGIGIDAETLPRIFELFTQENRAKDLVPGGLGIGLAIVRQIAALHGGVVEARSAGKGKGAEFTLRIPARGGVVTGT